MHIAGQKKENTKNVKKFHKPSIQKKEEKKEGHFCKNENDSKNIKNQNKPKQNTIFIKTKHNEKRRNYKY